MILIVLRNKHIADFLTRFDFHKSCWIVVTPVVILDFVNLAVLQFFLHFVPLIKTGEKVGEAFRSAFVCNKAEPSEK